MARRKATSMTSASIMKSCFGSLCSCLILRAHASLAKRLAEEYSGQRLDFPMLYAKNWILTLGILTLSTRHLAVEFHDLQGHLCRCVHVFHIQPFVDGVNGAHSCA